MRAFFVRAADAGDPRTYPVRRYTLTASLTSVAAWAPPMRVGSKQVIGSASPCRRARLRAWQKARQQAPPNWRPWGWPPTRRRPVGRPWPAGRPWPLTTAHGRAAALVNALTQSVTAVGVMPTNAQSRGKPAIEAATVIYTTTLHPSSTPNLHRKETTGLLRLPFSNQRERQENAVARRPHQG